MMRHSGIWAAVLMIGAAALAGCGGSQNASFAPTLALASPPPCSLRPASVHNLDGTPSLAQTYALALESAQAVAPTVAGLLTLYVGDDRYTAQFRNAVAAGRGASANMATPLVVRFSTPVHLDSAYVASLASPTSVACGVGNVWSAAQGTATPAPAPSGLYPPFDQAAFDAQAASVPASFATLAAHEAHPACVQPYSPAGPVNLVQPNYPLIAGQQGAAGTVAVEVTLSSTGAVADVGVYGSTTGSQALQDAAVAAARSSTFSAETFRCARVYGMYLFTAEFIIG